MSDLAPIFSTQNVHDDDGPVIDSYLIETDSPPDLNLAQEPIEIPALPPMPLVTRLISREIIVDPTWPTPTLILPADANRKSVYLRVYSPTSVATDGIRIASNNGEASFGAKVLSGNDWQLNAHTGAIWVWTVSSTTNLVASAPVAVEYWSVTE